MTSLLDESCLALHTNQRQRQPPLLHDMSLTMTPIHPPPKHAPPSHSARPRRPVLKLPLPLNPWSPSPAPFDLAILVADALKADPSPRRSQQNFFFTQTTNAPKPPPPTPTECSPGDWCGTPLSTYGESEEGYATPGSRTSMETERSVKSVRFVEEVADALERKAESGGGRVWKD